MSLKEQMLKAGLITEQEARQATHQKKVREKKAGHQTREQEAESARREAARQREANRGQDRQREQAKQAEAAEKESRLQAEQRRGSAVAAAYKEGLIDKWEGPRRYYFVRDGRVEYLMVTDDIGRRLEKGQTAIVTGEKNAGRVCLMTAGAAKKLLEAFPERVLVFYRD